MYINWKEIFRYGQRMLRAEVLQSRSKKFKNERIDKYISYLADIPVRMVNNFRYSIRFWAEASFKIEMLQVEDEVKLCLLREINERVPLIKPHNASSTYVGEWIRTGQRPNKIKD